MYGGSSDIRFAGRRSPLPPAVGCERPPPQPLVLLSQVNGQRCQAPGKPWGRPVHVPLRGAVEEEVNSEVLNLRRTVKELQEKLNAVEGETRTATTRADMMRVLREQQADRDRMLALLEGRRWREELPPPPKKRVSFDEHTGPARQEVSKVAEELARHPLPALASLLGTDPLLILRGESLFDEEGRASQGAVAEYLAAEPPDARKRLLTWLRGKLAAVPRQEEAPKEQRDLPWITAVADTDGAFQYPTLAFVASGGRLQALPSQAEYATRIRTLQEELETERERSDVLEQRAALADAARLSASAVTREKVEEAATRLVCRRASAHSLREQLSLPDFNEVDAALSLLRSSLKSIDSDVGGLALLQRAAVESDDPSSLSFCTNPGFEQSLSC